MKKIAAILLIVFTLSLVALSQSESEKIELLNKISKLTKSKKPEDADKAFQLCKEYLAKYEKDKDDKVKNIKLFMENHRMNLFKKALDENRAADAFATGKEILGLQPENAYVTMNLAWGGYEAMSKKQDKSFAGESVVYAKQTLAFLEANNLPKEFLPFKGKEDATAIMHFVIGSFAVDTDLKEAALSFYKAIQFESSVKKDFYPYYVVAAFYEKEYEAAAAKGPSEKLNGLVDKMLDAYARAAKYAELSNNANKDIVQKRLSEIYIFRKGSDTGLAEFINSSITTAMPEPKPFQ